MKPVDRSDDEEFAQQLRRALRELPDAPDAWQQAAVSLWTARSSAAEAQAQPAAWGQVAQALGRWLHAVLTFDSWAPAPSGLGLAHGMRSLRSATRHLLYSAQGRDIDLRITQAAEVFTLSGQILGPDESGQVELTPLGDELADGQRQGHRGDLDALGEFRLEGVPAGRYTLVLHLGEVPIVVEPIDVGEPGG